MRKLHLFFIVTVLLFSSCKRGIDIAQIESMPNGAAKDSAMLYYYMGLRAGDTVQVEYDFEDIERNSKLDENFPWYIYKTVDDSGEQGRVCQVLRGDTLIILGPHKHSVMKSGKFLRKNHLHDRVQVQIVRNGKNGKTGWISHGFINPLKHSWTMIFYDSVGVVGLLFILSLPFLLLFLVWKFFYWLIQDKIRDLDCFYNQDKIYFKSIYYIISVLIGLLVFIVDYDGSLVNPLKYDPHFFANFADYPLVLQLFPVLVLLWIASMVAMLWEMIKKYSTWWLLIYFPGIWSLGIIILALIFLASWAIYLVLPTVVTFAIMALVGGESSSGGGSSSSRIIGYSESGRPIREGSGGSIAYATQTDYHNRNN